MELKKYQKKVIEHLQKFLEILNENNNIELAYTKFWNEQNINVGFGGVPKYKNTIKNTPHICFKVPTGGGKTFLACSSIKPVFESMPFTKARAVVWLVPSNSILEQTIKNLKDVNHPYRQRVDIDFNGRVEVYTKEQLLAGQNFNPTTVNEQLSIFILSYDSLRSNRKDGRKIYQENGNLNQFPKYYDTPNTLVEGVDETALIQVINQLSPVVIVDESHNATTDLSVEMINNLNPAFVIDLTATPKENSNIISYVDAMQLKKENMVKLPVIVYNRHNQKDVILDAIDLRNKLEVQATSEQRETGRYIRPIVLFQAQPKVKENSETFEKLKAELINIGIPKEQIAIKTSEINELEGVDLLSPSCPIRYVITVNALKEGWDCSFAYILATLANRTSRVDVEQILGRILRLPYARKHNNQFLNMSYVLTSSSNFRETLENIVVGLNRAGFSKDDYRVAEADYEELKVDNINENLQQINMEDSTISYNAKDVTKYEQSEELMDQAEVNGENDILRESTDTEEFLSVDFNEVKELLIKRNSDSNDSSLQNNEIDNMFNAAIAQNQEYEKLVEEVDNNGGEVQPMEIRSKIKSYKINENLKTEVKNISLPKFFIESEPSIFITDNFTLLTKERLSNGFTLKNKDTDINFETLDNDVVKVDIEGSSQSIPKYSRLSENDRKYFKEYFSKMPQENKVRDCKAAIYKQISRIDTVSDKELKEYIDRVVDNMTKDQIDNLENYLHQYAYKIKKQILKLQEQFLEEQFENLVEQGSIVCKENYYFKDEIIPMKSISTIPKSLYEEEEDMNDFEYKVINEIVALDNIKWWHRNSDRKGFCINGFINHYPDFVVLTNSEKILLIETKGDHLENTESRQKVKLGRAWQHQAGNKYRYYMVFENKNLNIEGAYQFDKFIEIIKKL